LTPSSRETLDFDRAVRNDSLVGNSTPTLLDTLTKSTLTKGN